MTRRLFSWIGDADLRSIEPAAELGPLARGLDHLRGQVDAVHALCNYPPERAAPYRAWLEARGPAPVEVIPTPLSSPVDHEAIYRVVTDVLGSRVRPGDRLTFLLSSGTPAMHSIWLLLAKTSFPATMLQSSREAGVEEARVPFDIAMDFLPAFLRDPDAKLAELSEGRAREGSFAGIVQRSPQMKTVVELAHRAAQRDIPVLILGESGTGKELFAQAIHQASARRGRRLVAVNCGAIPDTLIDSELFGHVRGSFSGATSNRAGHFREANGGTLFLDEVGELSLAAQVKLLRALQVGTVMPVGSSDEVPVDVRVIAATHRSLPDEVRAGRFREDLFYRLAVAVLELPALRDRQGDLGELIDVLLDAVNAAHASRGEGYTPKELSAGARSKLLQHRWPGNVRELLNTITRATAFARGDRVDAEDVVLFPAIVDRPDPVLGRALGDGLDVPALLRDVERAYIARALEAAEGKKAEAARLLGYNSAQALEYRIKVLNE